MRDASVKKKILPSATSLNSLLPAGPMGQKLPLTLVLIILLLLSPIASAGEDEGLKSRIESLEREMSDNRRELEKLKTKVPEEGRTDTAEGGELFAIFGNFRASVNKVNDPLCQATCEGDNTQDGVSVRNNASVLGFRGEVKRGGLTAFYKYLLRAHNDEIFTPGSLGTIYYHAGLKGPFGSIKGGIIATPYKLPVLKFDPFYDTSAAARGFDGNSFGLSQLAIGFTKNAIVWQSPSVSGLTLDAAIIIDDSNEDDHDYNVGFKFKKGGLTTGAQHLVLQAAGAVAKSTGEGNATRLWFSYSTERWSLAGSGEKIYIRGGDDQEHYFLAGTFKPTPKLKLAATVGKSSMLNDPIFDGKGTGLGFFYTVVPKVQLFGLFSKVFRDADVEDREVFSMGMIYNFGWSHRR